MSEQNPAIHKGLAGVVVDTTAISSVNPATNSLLYRGYPVQELAAKCSFEEVAYLLWHGELPGDDDLEAFEAQERAQRSLPPNVRRAIDDIPTSAHPMDVLRTAVSVIGADDEHGEFGALENPFEVVYPKALRLMAQLPAIVAYDQRRRHGLELVEPHDDLDFASNFLYMAFGEVADPAVVDAFRVSLILYAEHSFNASTFTARVIASTLSDVYSAVTGAIGALKGPLHGGANEAVMVAFEEIGSADRAEGWLDDALAHKRKIMGFGHRVYKNGDSRVPTMEACLKRLVEHYDRQDVLDLYTALEQAMDARKGIKPNLDYPSGPVYNLMGFDTATFTPIFAAARVTGWTAHVIEQLTSNALIRPLSQYDGPAERHL
jgi:2-methylcitrate synthase/citrate synthase II